ncbi:hypothetical protein [Parasitella parasitica]|uniref:Uncharacterized protein n=1 Tax=Parasitella parasitica TaxID=35722 RepID=A0A0B7NSZ5_9FUNG|nr:hypothetical protein [Parasitella parasitica]
MDSISISEKHGAHKVFMSRFSDSLFVPSCEEDKKKKEIALKLKKTTFEIVSREDPAWIAKRLRRVILAAEDLLPVVKKLFKEFLKELNMPNPGCHFLTGYAKRKLERS